MIVSADTKNLEKAVALLRASGLVVMPTETVYGLAAHAGDNRAVAAIYEAKGRPSFNPLILHVASIAMARRYAILTPLAERLAKAFWPGPLTLILPMKENAPLSHLATAGLETVAVRVPAHAVAAALLSLADFGLVAPSANRSGKLSPTLASHAEEELGTQVAMIIDGGACRIGLESTVCDATGERPIILREGSITADEIDTALGMPMGCLMHDETPASPKPASPGMLLRHYAPILPLRLNACEVREGEALLAFGAHFLNSAPTMLNLSVDGDLTEAAANLFAMLRALDQSSCRAIAVMPIPENGIGAAINDRLRRGAATD